jgi:hypothetical protein
VTVVVDPHELGGGVVVRCAPGAVDNGLDALSRAGIGYRTALRASGFVCRIADLPSGDPCVTISPASAYWSYWVASRGGSWCYSNLGAANRRPPPGTVEGWSFAQDKAGNAVPPPRLAPPAPATGAVGGALPSGQCTAGASRSGPPSSPPPPAAPPARSGGQAAAPPPTSAPAPPPPATTDPSSATTGGASGTATTGADRAASDERSPAAPGTSLLADPATDPSGGGRDGAGLPVGTIAGALLVAGLAAGALIAARQRRAGAGA